MYFPRRVATTHGREFCFRFPASTPRRSSLTGRKTPMSTNPLSEHPWIRAQRETLAQWRKSMNLVGPGELEPHFEDAENAVQGLPAEGHWVDLGSGAGFPGIALAAAHPNLRVDLVESRKKRCVFLEHVLAFDPANAHRVRVRCERAESLAAGEYDGLICRAFAPAPVVLEHARRLLVPGGMAVLLLTEDAARSLEHDGFDVFHVKHYRVQDRRRTVMALRRCFT